MPHFQYGAVEIAHLQDRNPALGVVIDRINRITSSVLTDLVSAAAIAALPVIDRATGLDVGWFVLFGMIGSLGDVPGMTAREALLPAVARAARMDGRFKTTTGDTADGVHDLSN